MKGTSNEPDWKECAIALNRKLNLIGARFKDIEKQTISADVAFCMRRLIDEFKLDTDQEYVHPELRELQHKFNEIESLLHRLNFVSLSSRDALLESIYKKSSNFSFELGMLEAFA